MIYNIYYDVVRAPEVHNNFVIVCKIQDAHHE